MAGFLDKDTGLPYFWSQLKALFGGKADKVSGATNGNFAGLDANGNLTDSGHKHSDYKAASAHDSWSQVTGKPFSTIGSGLSVSNNALTNSGVRSASLGMTGTASSTAVRYQALSKNQNGTSYNYAINGTRYMEIVGTTSTNTYIFTQIDVFGSGNNPVIRDICTDIWGDVPTNVAVDSNTGTCTIVFATSAVRTVRIYID